MKLENAKVTLTLDDPNELIEAMNEQEKLEFFQSLSTHDPIIEYVMQQVFDGCTEDGYHGSITCSWDGNTSLQQFRKFMIEKGADEQSKKRIEYLERELARKDDNIRKLTSELCEYKYNGGDLYGTI